MHAINSTSQTKWGKFLADLAKEESRLPINHPCSHLQVSKILDKIESVFNEVSQSRESKNHLELILSSLDMFV